MIILKQRNHEVTKSAIEFCNRIILESGNVIDGTDGPGFAGDVGVNDDRPKKISELSTAEAERRIDACGLTVSPCFIDIYAHSDFSLLVNGRVSIADAKRTDENAGVVRRA